MKKIAIQISGGFGDTLTYASRLKSLLEEEKADKIDFYIINTYFNVTHMITDYLELSPYVDKIFIDMTPSNNDYYLVIDWRQDDAPRKYEIEIGHRCYYRQEDVEWADNILKDITNPIIIYPYTLGSSAWAKSEKYVRSPKEDWWKKLFKEVRELGGTPIVLGSGMERIKWDTDDVISLYTESDEFLHNIPLVQRSKGLIGIASWPWQIAHYFGKIDTCVLWLYNHFWVDRSISKDTERLHIFKTVPDRKDIYKHLRCLK